MEDDNKFEQLFDKEELLVGTVPENEYPTEDKRRISEHLEGSLRQQVEDKTKPQFDMKTAKEDDLKIPSEDLLCNAVPEDFDSCSYGKLDSCDKNVKICRNDTSESKVEKICEIDNLLVGTVPEVEKLSFNVFSIHQDPMDLLSWPKPKAPLPSIPINRQAHH